MKIKKCGAEKVIMTDNNSPPWFFVSACHTSLAFHTETNAVSAVLRVPTLLIMCVRLIERKSDCAVWVAIRIAVLLCATALAPNTECVI